MVKLFTSREEAGYLLAGMLRRHVRGKPLVLGIPEGGLPLAKIVAERLNGDLNFLLVKKVTELANPDLTVGSADEFGNIFLDDSIDWTLRDEEQLQARVERIIQQLLAKRKKYGDLLSFPKIEGRDVVLVDDGMVSGLTMLGVVRFLRPHMPRSITIATPVASPQALERFRGESDCRVVALEKVKRLERVSDCYDLFPKLSVKEGIKTLREFHEARERANVFRRIERRLWGHMRA